MIPLEAPLHDAIDPAAAGPNARVVARTPSAAGAGAATPRPGGARIGGRHRSDGAPRPRRSADRPLDRSPGQRAVPRHRTHRVRAARRPPRRVLAGNRSTRPRPPRPPGVRGPRLDHRRRRVDGRRRRCRHGGRARRRLSRRLGRSHPLVADRHHAEPAVPAVRHLPRVARRPRARGDDRRDHPVLLVPDRQGRARPGDLAARA